MIRIGNEDDLSDIVRMSREFWKSSCYDEVFCPDTARDFAIMSMAQGLLVVCEIESKVVGFACGLKSPLIGNKRIAYGAELAWWVDEEHRFGRNGIALLTHLEECARQQQIKYWNMMFMESSMPEKVKGIYGKMGYEKTEEVHCKRLF